METKYILTFLHPQAKNCLENVRPVAMEFLTKAKEVDARLQCVHSSLQVEP